MKSRLFSRLSLIAAAAALTAAVSFVDAAQSAAPPLSVRRIAGGLHLVEGGSGANAAFYVTPTEVFVIDAKMTADAAAGMLAEIAAVTPAPVTTLILTHSDGDHVNGLPGFPQGLRIIAHENVTRDLKAAAASLPALNDYLPTMTYASELALKGPGHDILLRNFGPAHTDGDTSIIFKAEKTAFVGDLVFAGRDPLVHRHKNGSSFGCVKTLEALLALRPEIETFLSGHAGPLTRTDVEALKTSMAEKQAKVKALIAAGKSLAEIKAAFGIEDQPAQAGRQRFPSLVEVIYLELTEAKDRDGRAE